MKASVCFFGTEQLWDQAGQKLPFTDINQVDTNNKIHFK